MTDDRRPVEEVRIPNDATYFPVSLSDIMLAAPLASRLLLGATLPGRVIQTVAFGAYAASALQDWLERQGVRPIDFRRTYGADVHHQEPMPAAVREAEVRTLVERVNDGFTARRIPRPELAPLVDRHLTDYIAGITGQRVTTSSEVRSFSLVQLVFPFALGSCDPLTGDVSLFHDTGVFEPHVIAHEFSHRKGYFKELEAQALAYLSLASSGEPVLVQAALCERLHRDLRVLAEDDEDRFRERVERSRLRAELRAHFVGARPAAGPITRQVSGVMKALYDQRLKLTGQNGISDYDRGFTDFLYTYERSGARHAPPAAGAVHAAA